MDAGRARTGKHAAHGLLVPVGTWSRAWLASFISQARSAAVSRSPAAAGEAASASPDITIASGESASRIPIATSISRIRSRWPRPIVVPPLRRSASPSPVVFLCREPDDPARLAVPTPLRIVPLGNI